MPISRVLLLANRSLFDIIYNMPILGDCIPLESRFWKKVVKRGPDDCWDWIAAKSECGYGRLWSNEISHHIMAHRFSFEIHHGRTAARHLEVCHKCDNPGCVNPLHLFEGTHQQNMTDMAQKGRAKNAPRHGTEHTLSKLTEEQIPTIRNRVAGGESLSSLGREYGVACGTIGDIRDRKTWRHVP